MVFLNDFKTITLEFICVFFVSFCLVLSFKEYREKSVKEERWFSY